jgi:hypothetical protein
MDPLESHPEVEVWLRRKPYLHLLVLVLLLAFAAYVIWTNL